MLYRLSYRLTERRGRIVALTLSVCLGGSTTTFIGLNQTNRINLSINVVRFWIGRFTFYV